MSVAWDGEPVLARPTSSLPAARVAPDEAVEWVFHVRPSRQGATFDRAETAAIFGPEWAEEAFAGGHVSVYARETANGPWTLLADEEEANEADERDERDERDVSGEGYVALAIAADLVRFFRKPPTQQVLQAFADTLKEDVADLGGLVALRENVREAAERAKELGRTRRTVGEVDVSLLLVMTERPFEAEPLVHELTELGLVLVDDDAFYWENTPEAAGDPWLFRVSPATEGDTFSLEAFEAKATYDSVVFSMNVARTAEPAAVGQAMLRAARHLARALNGDVLDDEGNQLEERALAGEIDAIIRRLAEAGFVPGSDTALRLF